MLALRKYSGVRLVGIFLAEKLIQLLAGQVFLVWPELHAEVTHQKLYRAKLHVLDALPGVHGVVECSLCRYQLLWLLAQHVSGLGQLCTAARQGLVTGQDMIAGQLYVDRLPLRVAGRCVGYAASKEQGGHRNQDR